MVDSGKSHVVRLYGRQAPDLNGVHVRTCGLAAGALCLGGAPKRYGNAVSNEDSVLLAEGPRRILLAIADAHNGPEASELALDWLAAHHVAEWLTRGITADLWEPATVECLAAINAHILESCNCVGVASRTTLVMAIIDIETGLAFLASAGDSHAFVVSRSLVTEVAIASGAGDFFLGLQPQSRQDIAAACTFVQIPICPNAAVLLASDGISTEGIGFPNPLEAIDAVMKALPLHPRHEDMSQALATAVADAARHVQQNHDSGDNISVAVACIPRRQLG